MDSSKVQAQLQALGNLAQSNQAILQALPRQIEQILRGTCSVPLGVGAQDQIKALLSLMDLAKEAVIVRGLLEKLAFEAMHDRDGTIQKEHSETFRWIVEHDADVDGTTLATNARKLYLSWLHSGYGIFHAAGKQGSGQSTLIQLLFKHPETRKQLLI
jgi:porphobilinogen deaminase